MNHIILTICARSRDEKYSVKSYPNPSINVGEVAFTKNRMAHIIKSLFCITQLQIAKPGQYAIGHIMKNVR